VKARQDLRAEQAQRTLHLRRRQLADVDVQQQVPDARVLEGSDLLGDPLRRPSHEGVFDDLRRREGAPGGRGGRPPGLYSRRASSRWCRYRLRATAATSSASSSLSATESPRCAQVASRACSTAATVNPCHSRKPKATTILSNSR
jgi:hypothetical protein